MTDISQKDQSSPAAPHAIHETLSRILAAVEERARQGKFDLALVIVLSLTALSSTWCAYQSQLWNGQQMALLADAEIATQDAHKNSIESFQRRHLDGMIMFQYLQAVDRNDTRMAEAIHRRMPSPLKETMDVWMKLDPLNNPDVPSPVKMPQYVLAEDAHARAFSEKARELRSAAQQAGNNGDTYVLLTLMFASVLFFGGITGTFQSRRLRFGLGGVALALFIITLSALATMPVASD